MAVLRPIGKNTRIAMFQREAIEGTYVSPTQAQHFVSESLKYTPSSIEDPSNIGKVFTSDMVKTGYTVEGAVEMKAHPYFIGDALYFTLGKDKTPSDPNTAYSLIWYNGDSPYARISSTSGVLKAEISDDGAVWVVNDDFGTDGLYNTSGGTASETSVAINGFKGYKSTVVGDDSSESSIPDISVQILKFNKINTGACIIPYSVASTVAKTHNIYADDNAVEDIPSFSMLIDRNFGDNKDIGLSGCKITSLGISFEPKNLVGLSVNISAKHQALDKEIDNLSVPVSKAFTTNLSKIFIGSLLAQEIKDSTININNNMYKDESIGEETFKSQGRQGATIEIGGNLNLTVAEGTEEETAYLQAEMQADRPVEYIAYMESSNYADDANKVKYSVLLRVRAMKLTDCSPTITGPERLTLPFTGQAVAPIIGSHIEVYVVNKDLTSYTPAP